ncbi:MAG: TIGR01777 family oxidoreductase, partial [Firmicutes bacterium]|nr:TIGR01777 family oxidoreductase [Bacillota bacterium]
SEASVQSEIQVLTRSPRSSSHARLSFHPWSALPQLLEGAFGVVNLTGEGIAQGRWTASRKRQLTESRLGPTKRLVEAMAAVASPPKVLVNASAIGYYGAVEGTPIDERAPMGTDFLARLCADWEAEAEQAERLGVRVVTPRLGVVLARNGGALPKLAKPVRLFAGAALGHGRQGVSWIHLDDLASLLQEALFNPAWHGPVNATAPDPRSHLDLMRLVARRLNRPLWPVPAWLTASALKLTLGEMAETMLLQGAYVLPRQAQAWDFAFRFPKLEEALEDLL